MTNDKGRTILIMNNRLVDGGTGSFIEKPDGKPYEGAEYSSVLMDAVMAGALTSHDRVVKVGQIDKDLMQRYAVAILRGMHSDFHHTIDLLDGSTSQKKLDPKAIQQIREKHRLIWNFVQNMTYGND